jgi:dephospho-CoA kinase
MKIIKLLLEILNKKPKAIFLAGAAGSGKTTTLNELVPNLEDFKIVNIDDTYEELLKKSGLGTNVKDFGPEELSQAGKIMGKAQKVTREKYDKYKDAFKNIVIDGTGAAEKPLLKKKQELEELGYDTFMVALYVAPITSLERNMARERSLPPSIVMRTWRDYTRNIYTYMDVFKNNISLIKTDDSKPKYNWPEIKAKFFDTVKGKGKPKSGRDLEKAKKDKEQLNKDIEQLIKKDFKFDNINQAKNKINKFLKI